MIRLFMNRKTAAGLLAVVFMFGTLARAFPFATQTSGNSDDVPSIVSSSQDGDGKGATKRIAKKRKKHTEGLFAYGTTEPGSTGIHLGCFLELASPRKVIGPDLSPAGFSRPPPA